MVRINIECINDGSDGKFGGSRCICWKCNAARAEAKEPKRAFVLLKRLVIYFQGFSVNDWLGWMFIFFGVLLLVQHDVTAAMLQLVLAKLSWVHADVLRGR